MKNYSAFIFDFDGVIKDSVKVKSEAFVQLYASEGKEFQRKVEEYHLANGGISRYVKFKVWNEWLGRSTSEEAIDELAKNFAQLVIDNVVASPYVNGAIEALESASENALCFIATGTPDEEINLILNQLELDKYFREVYGSSRKKSLIIKDILKRFLLSPSEVLFIGDAQTDYQAALENGLDFYLRKTDYNTDWFQSKPGITCQSNDLKFLNELITK
ncbi:HAD-IA family hydrolase [Schleiferiaceae bacterium]|nr:HAD-IA family hydrolase [Schleiferiaceae bacterium]